MSALRRSSGFRYLCLALFAIVCALSGWPESAHAQTNSRWGLLTEIVERDFTARGYPTTIRWIEPDKSIKVTMLAVYGSTEFNIRYDESAKQLFVEDKPAIVGANGELSRLDGSRLLWLEGGVYRLQPMKKYVLALEPLKPGWLTKIRDGAVRSGKIRAANPSLGTALASFSSPPQIVTPSTVVMIPQSATPVILASGPRLALIIGNSAYSSWLGELPNPANDAEAMAAALRQLGFTVSLVKNADQKSMKRAIAAFGEKLTAAGRNATGLFFYAGHGIQARGTNYLIPTNAEIRTQADVDLEAVAADTVLQQMEEAGAATNIVILDACRNMPLVRGFRSPTRGLAPMDAPNGSFIAYSTAPGSVAADGAGANSPFVTALVKNLGRKGESIESIFRDVRREVLSTTEGTQTPWDSSSLIQPFYFAGK